MREELKHFASSLGIENISESEEDIMCLAELWRCGAKWGPISTWFYEIKESPECYLTFFDIDLQKEYQKNPKEYKIRTYNNIDYLEMPSGAIIFDVALSGDEKTKARVGLGHQLVQLNVLEQERMARHLIHDAKGYKISKYLKAIGPCN